MKFVEMSEPKDTKIYGRLNLIHLVHDGKKCYYEDVEEDMAIFVLTEDEVNESKINEEISKAEYEKISYEGEEAYAVPLEEFPLNFLKIMMDDASERAIQEWEEKYGRKPLKSEPDPPIVKRLVDEYERRHGFK